MRISTIVRSGAVSVVLLGLLTACGTGVPTAQRNPTRSPERPLAAVEEAVAEIPGADFRAARAWDGTTAYVTATLSATEAFTGDPGALVDYSLAQLASQDELDRGRFVRFAFDAPGQTVESTIAILATLDIASEQYAGGDSVELSSSDLDARYGSWPSEVPTLPTTLGGAG